MASDILFGKTGIGALPSVRDLQLLTIEGLHAEDSSLFITKAAGELQDNFQVNYSMGDAVYVNAFQRRLVPMELPGVSILHDCGNSDTADSKPAFVRFYEDNSITRATKPVKLTYSGIVLKGYMTGLTLGTLEMQDVSGFSFVLKFLGYVAPLEANYPESEGSKDSGKKNWYDPTAADIAYSKERAAKELAKQGIKPLQRSNSR